jgi:DNA-binding Xre family transcriptional regulator
MYEQREKDINKAQVHIVIKIARALNCNIEDLIE